MDTVGMFEKYTTDYLKKMENLTIPENATLVTMDVTSLYPFSQAIRVKRICSTVETTKQSRDNLI
jgi:hypothetical protein